MCIAETSQQAVFHRAGRTCVAFLVSRCVPLCTGRGKVHTQPSSTWTTSGNTCPLTQGPTTIVAFLEPIAYAQSVWPVSWSRLQGRSKAHRDGGEDFVTKSHTGVFFPSYSCVSSDIPKHLPWCLSCQFYLKPWESRQVSAGFSVFPESESLHLHLSIAK